MNDCNRIRVLMLLDYLNISGTKTYVRALAKSFIKKGIHIVVAGKTGSYSKVLERAGCKVYHINFFGNEKKIIKKLENVVSSENINIIHNHSPISGVYGAEISRLVGVPLVSTFHGTYYNQNKMIEISKASKAIISVSPGIKEYWGKLGVDSVYIPLTIDHEEFSPKKKTDIRLKLGIPSQAPIILYAARQGGKKGEIGLYVMNACRQLRMTHGLKNLQCIIAGDGKKLNKIIKTANAYNSENGENYIHVIGKYYDMPSLFSTSTIVIGTGTSALEAMACKKPLIAAGIQGFIGVINKRNFDKAWNNGFGDHKFNKLKKTNSALFVKSLKKILFSKKKILKLGKFGRQIVKKHFDISINNRIIDIYLSLVNESESIK